MQTPVLSAGSTEVGFRLKRYGVLLGLLVGYAWYYVCRYSLTYAGPALAHEEGLDMRRIGLLVSVGQITVGMSKMGGSVLTADLSPSLCLVVGLCLTALFNVVASFAPSHHGPVFLVTALGGIWAVNGLWQGMGSPSCARIIDAWCLPKERGTFWAIWNTSNNIGGALAPLIVSIGVTRAGWRAGLCFAGLSALAVAMVVWLLVDDRPAAPLQAPSASKPPGQAAVATAGNPSGQTAPPQSGGEHDFDSHRGWLLFKEACIAQPGVFQLGCANFLVYAIRASIISWFAFYLIQGGRLSAGAAATLLSAFEVGGLFGSLAGGVISDWRTMRRPDAPIVGVRVETAVFAIGLLLLPGVTALCLLPQTAGVASFVFALFVSGFGLYVCQALTALSGLELVPRRAVGVSQGFLGLAAYVGAASAGLPLGYVIQGHGGWRAWKGAMLASCAVAFAVLLPLRHMPSREQRKAGTHSHVRLRRAVAWPNARRQLFFRKQQ